MKRGGPLRRGKRLQSGGQLARRKRIKPRSDKQAAVYEIRRELVAGLLIARPWCQITWDAKCQQRSVDVHEPRTRARHCVDITDENECVTGCRYCHDQVHDHPAEAERRGFLVPSGPIDKPWEEAS